MSSTIEKKKTTPFIPTETLLRIQTFLPIFSKHLIPSAWKRWRPTSEEKHHVLWSKIFKDHTWLIEITKKGYNPCFVGNDLFRLYNGHPRGFGNYHLALVLAHTRHNGRKPTIKGNLEYESTYLFQECLEEYKKLDNGDYLFPKSKIILNTYDITHTPRDAWDKQYNLYTPVTNPLDYIGYKYDILNSAYLYWHNDNFQVHNIEQKDFMGVPIKTNIDAKKTKTTRYNTIVGFQWNYPPKSRSKRQHCFEKQGTKHINILSHKDGQHGEIATEFMQSGLQAKRIPKKQFEDPREEL